MLTRLSRHLTYANVMATLAFFVAVGGSSYAAIRVTSGNVANNTLRSEDIRDGSLRSRDVRDGTLAGADVADGSLRAGDFARGALPQGPRGPEGNQGPAGPQGFQGAQGLPGFNGANGATNVVVREGTGVARCRPGERATGGGAEPLEPNIKLIFSRPRKGFSTAREGETPDSWGAAGVNLNNTGVDMRTFVICSSP